MASTQQLKHRIGSVKNTKQITKAMELVAASKMKRAQENAARTRDYSRLAGEILTRLRSLTDVSKHALYEQRDIKTRLHIVITSDRGLAGAYNNNVLRQLAKELQVDQAKGIKSQVITIGKQAAHFVGRLDGVEVLAVYQEFPEHPTPNDVRPILNTIIDRFAGDRKDVDPDIINDEEVENDADEDDLGVVLSVDAVDILFTNFRSSIAQDVTIKRLLPAAFSEEPVSDELGRAEFEPSPDEVLSQATIRLIEAQLTQALLESAASEHSMRMMAMKSATDNANELIDDLTLAFNTARQAAITQEIAEITGGVEAMK